MPSGTLEQSKTAVLCACVRARITQQKTVPTVPTVPILNIYKDINMIIRNASRNAAGTVAPQTVPNRATAPERRKLAEASVATIPPDVLPAPSAEYFPQQPTGLLEDINGRAVALRAALEAAQAERVERETKRLIARDASTAISSPDLARRRRGDAVQRLAERFGWSSIERRAVTVLQEATEAGMTGAYIAAQRIVEKVDGTNSYEACIGGHLDREAFKISWLIGVKADWKARRVSSDAMLFVLVFGASVREVEERFGHRHGTFGALVDVEVRKLALDLMQSSEGRTALALAGGGF